MDKYAVLEGAQVTGAHIAQALELDRLVYPTEYHVTLEQCLAWNQRNNRIYTMLQSATGQIMAYVNLSPVTEEYYDRIAGGEFLDTLLPPEAIVAYDGPGPYHLYFSSVVVHPDHRNGTAVTLLLRTVLRKLTDLGRDGFFAERMVADAVSGHGEKLCRLFGLEKLNHSDHSLGIYQGRLLPPCFRATLLTRELFDLYAKRAESMVK